MEWLAAYGLFLAEAVTVVAAFGIAVGLAAGAMRGRRTGHHGPPVEITDLNDRYRRMAVLAERRILPRKAFRARRREERRERRRLARDRDRRRIFVIDFKGDIRASRASALADEVTTILSVARNGDEVVVRLDNSGGAPNGHGLGASQLARIRERGIRLTVAVDRVAASGGYMMACVGDRIIAAPFALVGSIGVFAAIPNLHRLLQGRGIDVEQLKAGENKLTVTMVGRTTEADRAKLQDQLDTTHRIFKEFVAEYRPSLDIEHVATGEYWHAREALSLGLVDEVRTSDDYLHGASGEADIYRVRGRSPANLRRRFGRAAESALDRLSMHLGD